MRLLRVVIAILAPILLLSCSKEYSAEDGGGPGLSCKVSNITVLDEITGAGVYALNTRYDNSGRSINIELYDSALNSLDYDIDLSYPVPDTIMTTMDDKLVLDGSKRLKKLLTPLDPTDPSGEQLVYEFRYNGNGQLIEKTLTTSGLPIVLFQTVYTWSSNNLIKIESNSSLTGTKQKLIDISMEYDMSKTPKNFIPIYPDAFESYIYVSSVDMGKPSMNLLARMTVIFYDDQGVPSSPEVTEISEAKFSNDGYLTEWYVNGSSFDALGIFRGRNRFTYKCN